MKPIPAGYPNPPKSDLSDLCVSETKRAKDIQWHGDILEKFSDSNET